MAGYTPLTWNSANNAYSKD